MRAHLAAVGNQPESRVEEIIRKWREADESEKNTNDLRWEVAELIHAELATKTLRQLAAALGKSHMHVSRMAQVHELRLVTPGLQDFNDGYQRVKQPKPPPRDNEAGQLPEATKPDAKQTEPKQPARKPRRASLLKWAKQLEQFNLKVPYAEMTDDELYRAVGAAEFCYRLLRGEEVRRENSKKDEEQP